MQRLQNVCMEKVSSRERRRSKKAGPKTCFEKGKAVPFFGWRHSAHPGGVNNVLYKQTRETQQFLFFRSRKIQKF